MFQNIIDDLNNHIGLINREVCEDIVVDIHKILFNKDITKKDLKYSLINEVDAPGKNIDEYLERDKKFPDKFSAYEINFLENKSLDIKLFFVKNFKKRTISWIQNLTPNYEDGSFARENNVGVDFCFNPTENKFLIVLSNENILKTYEIKERIKPTDFKILNQWFLIEIEKLSKKEIHESLWSSLDLAPINKEFFEGIKRFFNMFAENNNIQNINLFTTKLMGKLIFIWFLKEKKLFEFERLLKDSTENDRDYYLNKLKFIFKEFDDLAFNLEQENNTIFIGSSIFEETNFEYSIEQELIFPNNFFELFYDFLDHYNFTTDESTSDYLQIAIDPEMLGQIFEQLLGEIESNKLDSKKEEVSAFYTPRKIVDQINTNVLRENFNASYDDENLKREFEIITEQSEVKFLKISKNLNLSNESIKTINSFITNIKTFDPACGSGAFPIGLLNILVRVLKRINGPDFDVFNAKKEILKNCIFGSDIEPNAIEISKLRALLSLVVEDDFIGNSDQLLPNLEFNFICSNSLIPLKNPDSDTSKKNLESDLKNIRSSYFNSINDKEKKSELRKKYLNKIKQDSSLFGEERELQLKSFNPFASSNICSFFDSDMMFGVDKFDLVVGNPPYLSSAEHAKANKDERRKITEFYDLSAGTYDLYIPFIELGIKHLKTNGSISMIVKGTLISHDYAFSTRQYLSSINLVEVVDYTSTKIFKDASVYPVIFCAVNNKINSEAIFKKWNNSESKFLTNRITVDKNIESWGIYFLENEVSNLYIKINNFIDSTNIYNFEGAATTDEYYRYFENLQNTNSNDIDNYKLLTTGLIDPFESRWGKQKLNLPKVSDDPKKITEYKYLQDSYDNKSEVFFPVLSKADLEKINPSRAKTSSKPKFIVAGMAKPLETFMDKLGEYVAFKSTFVLNIDDLKEYEVNFLYKYLNSDILTFILFAKHPGSLMSGGYLTISKKMLNDYIYPINEIKKNIASIDYDNIQEMNEKMNILFNLNENEINIMNNFIYNR